MSNTNPLDSQIYRFVTRPRQGNDPRSASLLADAHTLGLTAVQRLDCLDIFFIEGTLAPSQVAQLASNLLSDPITQSVEWGRLLTGAPGSKSPGYHVIEAALRPGVTDPVAEQIVRSASVLGITGVQRAAVGLRYEVYGETLTEDDLLALARRLLVNNIIQHFTLGEIEPAFPQAAQASGQVEALPIRSRSDDRLLALSEERRAALDLAEMQAIQQYYQAIGRDPTDVEFETIAQTWSEHCVHKTFKAAITLTQEDSPDASEKTVISNLLNTYLRAATQSIQAPWVRSAFVDNAGMIDFDDEFEVSFKVETHNHPSAIEPFGGANTGVGGVIRDVLGVSAKPIAATDILCFGPPDLPLDHLPEGVLHPRRIRSGVIAGVQDYGNKIGIPTVNGAIVYDPGFTANPLVFCGCIGIAPKGSHPRQPLPGDRVIVLGGRTGRDGLRGATFSSMTMDGQTGEVSGASVQIGDPITEKGLIEVILRARDARLYHAITDCGAGGLSSAVGEMSSQTGAEVELQHVELKYPGLAPWEIWLSEAQERMVLAVPAENIPALRSLCDLFEVNITDIGAFNDSQRLVVRYAGQVVLDLHNEFLHNGIPQRQLQAVIRTPAIQSDAPPGLAHIPPTNANHPPSIRSIPSHNPLSKMLLSLLAHPDIASKADVVHVYDHEVQGATIIKPLIGKMNDGPSDGAVLKPLAGRGRQAIVLSNGVNPQYGKVDAYRMALSVVDEAIRNAVAVGADPQRIALLDNFCWGDPKRPETLGELVQAARGCYDAALFYQTPFISGKDSLNNEYLGADGQRHAIPPTLLISAIGIMDNFEHTCSMDLKTAGNPLYLLGEHQHAWGGSHASLLAQTSPTQGRPPGLPQQAPQIYQTLHQAIWRGWVRACHDLSEGGLGVAAAEMCIGGRLGLNLVLPDDDPATWLYSETNGCLLVEVDASHAQHFEALFSQLAIRKIGMVSSQPRLQVTCLDELAPCIDIPLERLLQAWKGDSR
jgi:phosphoribosylformylglycinamidine synthase